MNGHGDPVEKSLNEPLVSVSQGMLRGLVFQSRSGTEYTGFLGIPYAEKPKRFELAKPAERWEGIRDATKYGPRCMQKDSITKQVWGSEDCLFLNVFTPELPKPDRPETPFPVFVYIYGGAFLMGSGDEYDPKYLMDKDIIVVTLNYRVGIFGFLNTEDGLTEENLGLKDQVLALKWIQQNIDKFGGDRTRVTLVGQSAGSACVHYHILSPMSQGLFSAAIMQSGTALSPWGFQFHPLTNVRKLSELLSGPTDDTKKMVDFFKEQEAGALAAGDYDYKIWKSRLPLLFGPSKETPREGKEMFLPDTPWNMISSRKFSRVPLIIGMTAEEGLNRAGPVLHSEKLLKRFNEDWDTMAPLNLMYRTLEVDAEDINRRIRDYYFGSAPVSEKVGGKLIDVFSDRYFFRDIFATARIHAAVNGDEYPVYMYMFAFKSEICMLHIQGISEVTGVVHSDDLQYLFDTTLFPAGLRPGTKYENMSKHMVHLWTDFVCNRSINTSPLGSSYKPWQPLKVSSENRIDEDEPLLYYLINNGGEMVEQSEDLMRRMKLWDELLPLSILG